MVDQLASLEKRIDVLFESLKNRKSLENLVQKFEKWRKFKSVVCIELKVGKKHRLIPKLC